MSGGYFKFGLLLMALVALDYIAAPVVATLVLVASANVFTGGFSKPYQLLALFAGLLSFVFVRQEARQQRGVFLSRWTIATRTAVAWLGVVATLLLIGYATKVSAVYSRRALFVWFLATPLVLTAVTILLRHCFRRAAMASGNVRTAVIAGVNGFSLALAETITSRPELCIELKGFFEDRCVHRLERGGEKILGTLGELAPYAKQQRIDIIFVGMPYYLERTKALLRDLRDTTASVYLIPDISFIDVIQSRAEDICGIPVIALCETPFQGWSGFQKRAMDVVLGTILLLIALPLMAVIALAVKLTSPGSVLFKQRRYGLDGEEIIVYKFRTMFVSEDGSDVRQATRDDPRVTPLGRFLRRYSLDELPQLINVLQGRMSLVGPRPHAVAHNEEYRKLIDGYMVRHKVSPGITGLAQVNGCRGETSNLAEMQRRVQYDLDYLRHWSLMLDTKILVKTIATLFSSEKAY